MEGDFIRKSCCGETFGHKFGCRHYAASQASKEQRGELESLRSQLALAVAESQRLRAGLEHYADRENWHPSEAVTDDMDDADYDRLAKDFYTGGVHGFHLAQAILEAQPND